MNELVAPLFAQMRLRAGVIQGTVTIQILALFQARPELIDEGIQVAVVTLAHARHLSITAHSVPTSIP